MNVFSSVFSLCDLIISLNEKYPPIPVGENDRFDILGKVVGKNHPSEIKEYMQ